jgi:integrase
LIVRKASTGRVSFIIRVRGPRVDNQPGKVQRHTLGHWPDMGLEAARAEAARVLGLIRRGEDPAREDLSAASLERAYREAIRNRPLRPRTLKTYEDQWNRHLAKFGKRPMTAITSAWVRDRMDAAKSGASKGSGGVTEANRLRSLISTICTEWCAHNPGALHPIKEQRVRKAVGENGRPTAPRKQKLTVEQARTYAEAIERYAATDDGLSSIRRNMADYLILNMFVGLRRSNGLGLRWEWVDLKAGRIVVPETETKTGRAYSVSIPPRVAEMLKRRKATAKTELVFPGRRDPTKPLHEPGKAHKAVLELAGLPRDAVTLHDMRRTLGSAMIATGSDITAVRDQLGHSNIATTSIYLNLDGESTVRDAVNRVAAAFGGEGDAA